YFARLLGACCRTSGFTLPNDGAPETELLGALFDLLRNGHGHQYQQVMAHLSGGGDLVLSVAKVVGPARISELSSASRSGHLVFERAGPDMVLRVRPDLLFLDFRGAITRARLTERGLPFAHFERTSGKLYGFTVADLEQALERGGIGRA